MASSSTDKTTTTSKRYRQPTQTANTKKILEVKEVIQNRTNNEIQIVLEYYNNDVGKVITAFLNDEVKDILSKKNSLKNTDIKNQVTKKQSITTNNNNTPFNVNSLVESIISKYTKNEDETVISPKNIEINLNTSINSNSNNLNEIRPNSLEIKKEDIEVEVKKNDKETEAAAAAVININAKKILEKSHKDLQRQIVSLSKLTINFDEEIDKTQNIITDLFGKLRNLINEREIQLKNELERLKTQGNELFINRQKKANEFKIASDNADRLSDAQVQELKANIKNFVSERKLDEDLGMTKRFSHEYDKIELTIKTFGQLVKIKENHYETNATSSEITTTTTTPLSDQQPVINEEFNKKIIINDNKPPITSTPAALVEAKKPQRNRNRNTNNSNENPTKINGYSNGQNYNNRPINVNNNNNNNINYNKRPQRQNVNGYVNGNNKLLNGYNTVTNGDNKAVKLNET